jgi:hypothetical protein
MAWNGVLAAWNTVNPSRVGRACQGFAGAFQAGRIRELWQAVQGSIPLSWPSLVAVSGAIWQGALRGQSGLDPAVPTITMPLSLAAPPSLP